MGILNKTRVYLAGFMQNGDGTKWRDVVQEALNPRGIITFNPYEKPYVNGTPEDIDSRKNLNIWMENGAFEEVAKHMKKVRSEDLRQVDLSDFLVFYIDHKIPTWGTVEELTLAVREKKPIFLVIKDGLKHCPLWILGMMPLKYMYNNLDDALDMIKKIDDGVVPIDSERWHLLKPEFR